MFAGRAVAMEDPIPVLTGFGLSLEIAVCGGGRVFLGNSGGASGVFQMADRQQKKKPVSAEAAGKAAGLVYGERCVAILCERKENFYGNCKRQKLNIRANALIFAPVRKPVRACPSGLSLAHTIKILWINH